MRDISLVDGLPGGVSGYRSAVEALGAFRPEDRGSGTKTALLGAVAALLFQNSPRDAIRTCANQLGTDTDSIATMAGAILGATVGEDPDVQLADRRYIEREAERMWAIAERPKTPSFPYPSIVTWAAPRSQIDCLGTVADGLAVAGLGPVAGENQEILGGSGNGPGAWSWVDLWFGQRVLIKRRARPNPLPESQNVPAAQPYATASLLDAPHRDVRTARPAQPATSGSETPSKGHAPTRARRTLHEITNDVIASGFDPAAVGLGLLEVADREDGIELAGQYAAILAKARLTRIDRDRQR